MVTPEAGAQTQIEVKQIGKTTVSLIDNDGVSVVRVDHNNGSEVSEVAIGADASRDDQRTLAAWNVDFPISEIAEWIGEDAMEVAQEDIATNHWA